MPYCSECGEELEGDEEYCPGCGNKINEDSNESQKEEKTENNQENNENTGSGSSLITGRRLILISVILIGFGFLLPKLPALMTAAGIEGAPGVEPLEIRSTNVQLSLEEGVRIQARVYNPNSFNAELGRITYTLKVDGREVASGQKQTYETVPGQTETTVTAPLDVDLAGSIDAGIGTLADKIKGEKTYSEFEGKWHYSLGPGSFSIPFQHREEI
jgi:LEA14-like dessication related protein